jgi:hypothetical protein
MHYKNGREAANGDPVVARNYAGRIVSGTVHNLRAGTATCNCDLVVVIPGGTMNETCRTVSEMYHAEDAFKALEPAEVTVKSS